MFQVQLFSVVNERFPSMSSKFFLKHFVTIPMAAVITGMTIHFMLLIRRVSTHKLLIYQYVCLLLFVFKYYAWPIGCSLSFCVWPLIQ